MTDSLFLDFNLVESARMEGGGREGIFFSDKKKLLRKKQFSKWPILPYTPLVSVLSPQIVLYKQGL